MTCKEFSEIIWATRPRTEYSKMYSKYLGKNDKAKIDKLEIKSKEFDKVIKYGTRSLVVDAVKALTDYAESPENELRGDITTGYTYGGKDMNTEAKFGLAISRAEKVKLVTDKGDCFDVKIDNITQNYDKDVEFEAIVLTPENKNRGYRTLYMKNPYKIENVIFNDPATIIIWADGTKTVVKTQNGEPFDPEKGFAMAIAKKALGNQGNYFETFKKWLPEKKEPKEPIIDCYGVFDGIRLIKTYKRKCDATRYVNKAECGYIVAPIYKVQE